MEGQRPPRAGIGLRPVVLLEAHLAGVGLDLSDVGLTVLWSRFDDCRFVSCRWEGHFDDESDYLGCMFTGRINGCAWGGAQGEAPGAGRYDEIAGNDLREAIITDNVGWRFGYPVGDQVWPEGYVPRVDV